MKDLIKHHKREAQKCLSSFEKIDNIAHPFSADRLYEQYLQHKAFAARLKKQLKKHD